MWVCGCVQWQVCVFYRWTQKTHLEIYSSSKMQPHGVCLVFTPTSKPINGFVLMIIQRTWSSAPFVNFQRVSRLTWFQTCLRKAMIGYFLLWVLSLFQAPAYIFLIQTVGSRSSWLRLSQRRPLFWKSGSHLHVTTREITDTAAARASSFMYSPAYLLCEK